MKSWTEAGEDLNLERSFLGAGSKIVREGVPVECPACGGDRLRFYHHQFSFAQRRGGTLWTWCPACHRWAHLSGAQLPAGLRYEDVFAHLSLEAFGELERVGLLDRLDQMCDEGTLPQCFSTGA